MPDENNDNNLSNIRNVLGFLLAGFGAVLSFLGIRSSEVTTILRNDAWQASLIALILLAGVLAAVWAIMTNSKARIPALDAIATGVLLLSVGALVVFFIPIGPSPYTISGWTSLGISCVLALAGIAALVKRDVWVRNDNGAEQGRWRRLLLRSDSQDKLEVDLISILIVVSVLLTGIATYGAMRLESKSQLSFTSQVGASFAVDGPLATVSVDVAATKLPQDDYVFVDVYAVPAGINLTNMCTTHYLFLHYFGKIPVNIPDEIITQIAPLVNHCATDPCIYFYGEPSVCRVVLNGSINPDATGDVNKTLSVPFKTAAYEDMDVRAEVCSLTPDESCVGSSGGENSRLDWVITRLSRFRRRGLPHLPRPAEWRGFLRVLAGQREVA